MTTPSLQLKIGFLVLAVLAGAIAISAGLQMCTREHTIRYHTYLDESVSGLDVGSAVKFRGIQIGTIGAMNVAPDHRRIDVALDVALAENRELALDARAPQLRAKLASSGITGVKYVDLDPAANEAPPTLGFSPAARYIPAGTSFVHSLETHVERLGDDTPALVARAIGTLDKLDRILDEVDHQHLPTRIAHATSQAELAFGGFRELATQLEGARLATHVDDVLDGLGSATRRVHDLVARIDADGDIDRTVREVGGVARELRALVQEVERDPDMLVKGRARSRRP